jgi:hypothetical protein
MNLAYAMDWRSWFEPDHFMDVFAIPLSAAIAAIVVNFSKTKLFQIVLERTLDEKNPIIQFKDLSGLKLYSLWNLVLAFGLLLMGISYNKLSSDSFIFTAYVSFYGASLGWAYAFGYFAQAWPKQERKFNKILLIFTCVAVLEKLLVLYSQRIEIKPLFYYTITPLILLINAAFHTDKNVFAKKFWLSSLLFNLALIGVFCIDSLKEKGSDKVSILNIFLVIAPIVATYVSLIFCKKYYCPDSSIKPSRGVQIIALLSIAAGAGLLFKGVSKVSQYIADEISKYEQETSLRNPQSTTNPP